jgi:hypothetical protein
MSASIGVVWTLYTFAILQLSAPQRKVRTITHRNAHASSVTGEARNPFANGKLFGVRQTTEQAVTRDLPITLRTKSKFTVSPRSGSSVHFASNSSRRPPVSTTKSTSRVRSRQKKRLPVRPARRSRSRSWAKTKVSHTAPAAGDCRRVSSDRIFSRAQSRPVSAM